MQIKEIKISEIKLYEKNNKIHKKEQIELLKKTIIEFGFTNPVLLSDKNECIGGHGRIQAMQELGKEKIPAVYIKDLTPEQVRKLRLLDNKIAELAEDNLEAIKFELEELQDIELSELYDLTLEDDFDDDFSLPDGDKGDIEQIAFTLHNLQADNVRIALNIAKGMGDYGDTGNENSNGNALARVVELFITQNQ